jgi:hypothetical protein
VNQDIWKVWRFTKLHGSLDWYATEGAIRRFGLPFGASSVEPFLQVETPELQIINN